MLCIIYEKKNILIFIDWYIKIILVLYKFALFLKFIENWTKTEKPKKIYNWIILS